jgi:hypothetical protein
MNRRLHSGSTVRLRVSTSSANIAGTAKALVAAGAHFEPAELDGLIVQQLKTLCATCGLKKTGVRADLVAQLCAKRGSEGPPHKKQKTEVRVTPPPAAQRRTPAVGMHRQARRSRNLALTQSRQSPPFPSCAVPSANFRDLRRSHHECCAIWDAEEEAEKEKVAWHRHSRSSRRCSRRRRRRRSPMRSARPAAMCSTRRMHCSWPR